MTPAKDMITERYQQENPEGARLVSEEAISSPRKAESSKTKRRKSSKTGKAADTEKPAKESAGAAKKADSTGKSAEKPASKKPEQPAEESQSVKTPSVMKLVADTTLADNQVIAAGKSRIPRQLRGIEPLSRVMRRQAEGLSEAERVNNSPTVSRDLTEMVIEQNVPQILRRFNACDCEKCRSELARLAAEEIPSRYVKLPELADLSYDGFSKDEKLLIQSLSKTAVSVMIRLMMTNKKRNFH